MLIRGESSGRESWLVCGVPAGKGSEGRPSKGWQAEQFTTACTPLTAQQRAATVTPWDALPSKQQRGTQQPAAAWQRFRPACVCSIAGARACAARASCCSKPASTRASTPSTACTAAPPCGSSTAGSSCRRRNSGAASAISAASRAPPASQWWRCRLGRCTRAASAREWWRAAREVPVTNRWCFREWAEPAQ